MSEIEEKTAETASGQTSDAPDRKEEVPEEGQFCIAGNDGEVWLAGPFIDPEEAYAEMEENYPGAAVHMVDEIDECSFLPDLDWITEQMDEAMAGDYKVEDPQFSIRVEDEPEARKELEAWAKRWIRVENRRFTGKKVSGVGAKSWEELKAAKERV